MNGKKFGRLLKKAVDTIAALTGKKKGLIKDEIGYAIGRNSGGSPITYWIGGHVPSKVEEREVLARELVKRQGLTRPELEEFLKSADYLEVEELCDELFPVTLGNQPSISDSVPLAEFDCFVVGSAITEPRQFFGREYELNCVFNLWKRFPLQNAAIIGVRRSGKTSFLKYLQTITRTDPSQLRPGQRHNWLPQPNHYRWIFFDFQNPRWHSKERIFRHILNSLNIPIPDPCTAVSFMEAISEPILNPTIILMDEVGAALQSPKLEREFWQTMRAVSLDTEGWLGFVLTSHELPSLLADEWGKSSPFFNIFGHTLHLKEFNEIEARELIASSLKPFTEDDIEWILTESGRWPFLLQILCHARLMALEEGQLGSDWKEKGLHQIKPYRYLLGE